MRVSKGGCICNCIVGCGCCYLVGSDIECSRGDGNGSNVGSIAAGIVKFEIIGRLIFCE